MKSKKTRLSKKPTRTLKRKVKVGPSIEHVSDPCGIAIEFQENDIESLSKDFDKPVIQETLIIKLSGSATVNERLLIKDLLTPYLHQPPPEVIVDLGGLGKIEAVSIMGVLNAIRKEFQLVGVKVKFCSLPPNLLRYLKENRLDKFFDIIEVVDQAKKHSGGEERED